MEVGNDENEEEDEEAQARVVPAKKRSRKQVIRGGNRRKTMGDGEEEEHEKPRGKKRRKTMNDIPSASSSFHTQTLTQLKFPGKNHEDEDWKMLDSEDEEPTGPVQKALKRGETLAKNVKDEAHMDLAPGPSNKENEKPDEQQIKDSEDEDDVDLIQETPRGNKSGNPSNSQLQKTVTPSNRCTKEIPSSQSPATPMLLKYAVNQDSPLKHVSTSTTVLNPEMTTPSHQRTKLDIPLAQSPTMQQLQKYSPANQISPSKHVSTNTTAPVSTLASILKTPTRKSVISDSYSSSHSSPATPTPKANARTNTPTKQLRFDLPANKENITPGRTKPKSPKQPLAKTNREPLKEVIPDSDEDLGETTDEDDDEEEEGIAQVEQTTELEQITILEDEDEDDEDTIMPADDDESEAPYAIGAETQAILISSGDQSSRDLGAHGSSDKSNEESRGLRDEAPRGTQLVTEESTVTAETTEVVIEQTPVSSPHKSFSQSQAMTADPYTQGYTEGLTRGLESQRVPLEVINATGPVTDRSDIIISLYGEHVKKIVDQTKTHEFRSWKMPPTVHRVWIYITKPISTLKYMCIFGPPAEPGEIDENGIGNKDFNEGKKRCASFAYEVLQVYELNNPVPLETMKRNGWPSAPQKYAYVPPAIVGQLTGNLRCALFGNEAEHEDLVMSSPRVTESQELEQQFRSDIAHSTQLVASDYPDKIIPSSQSPPKAKKSTPKATPISDPLARPALPRSLSGSSSRILPPPMSQRRQRSQRNSSFYVRPSQATTVSEVSSSSPVPSPDRPVSLPRISSSQAPLIQIANSSSPSSYRTRTHSHSLRSSQFPTKSQMLPDSLLNDDVPEPPPIIFDSADEDSD